MVYHANKISPQRNANLGLILDTRRDTIWTVKDDTDGTPQGSTAPILKMLSVEHVRIAWWKNSEHRTLRTRLATDSRRNGKTKERTGRKNLLDNGYTTCYDVGTVKEQTEGSDTTENERLTMTQWDTPKHHRGSLKTE